MSPESGNRIESLLQEVSAILLSENHVSGGEWVFRGWTHDARAVVHKIKVRGYERTGPGVEKERAARLPGGEGEGGCTWAGDDAPCETCPRRITALHMCRLLQDEAAKVPSA